MGTINLFPQISPRQCAVYNTLVVPANNATALTLRQAIVALSGGAIPIGREVIGAKFLPLAGGPGMVLKFSDGTAVPTAVLGGGGWPIAAGAMSDPLDCPFNPLDKVFLHSATTAATSCDAILYLGKLNTQNE